MLQLPQPQVLVWDEQGHIYRSNSKRPLNRWQQLKERSLTPKRSFSPNTRFDVLYRSRSPILSSDDEEEKSDFEKRSVRSSAPAPTPSVETDVEHNFNKEFDTENFAKNLKCISEHEPLPRDPETHSEVVTPMSSPRISDLGLSTPPPGGFMDDFITGIFFTLDDNGEPIFPDDNAADKSSAAEEAAPAGYLFLGDNGNFSVTNKENIDENRNYQKGKKYHGNKSAENCKEKFEFEGIGIGSAADLPGSRGTFLTKTGGKRVLCYD